MKILCVEDEGVVGEVLCDLVRELGHEAMCCSGAFDAIDLITRGTPFDLIISDVNLGSGPDGNMLSERVRERWPHIPLILITGNSLSAAKTLAERILLKPCTLGMLEAAINCTTSTEPKLSANIYQPANTKWSAWTY